MRWHHVLVNLLKVRTCDSVSFCEEDGEEDVLVIEILGPIDEPRRLTQCHQLL